MPNADYALQLARRGYVVLAPDLRCFGERLDWNPEDHYACDTNLVHAAMAGWNPLTQNIWDLRRCLDVLEQHPLVDPARLGMVGISYGGTVTLFTAARRRPRGGVGGERLLLLVGRQPQDALEHVRLPDPLRDAGPARARGPRRAGRAAPDAGRVGHRGPPLPGGDRRRVGAPHPPRLRAAGRAPSAWCTTSSRAATSGTAPRPCPSSTAGSATRPRPPPADARALERDGSLSSAVALRRLRLGGAAEHLVERRLRLARRRTRWRSSSPSRRDCSAACTS